RTLAAALGLLVAAVLLQLVPLPHALLQRLSPAADRFLLDFDLAYASRALGGQPFSHPLSINPAATWLAVAFVCAFSLFLLGLMRGLGSRQVERLAGGIVLLSVAIAVIGIVQKAVSPTAIYGLRTVEGSSPYGPFFNRNHF